MIWTPEAEQDRFAVWDYIAADNPVAAVDIDNIFSGAANQLANYPKLGKEGWIPGTRELIPHENYRLVYELDGDTIWILSLISTARLWPPVK